MKSSIFVFLLISIFCGCQCSPYVDLSWINTMVENINRQVQDNVQQAQQHIDRTVNEQLSKVDRLIDQVRSIPMSTNGQTVIVNNSNNVSRSIFSGTGLDGKPYYRDIEDKIVNNIQYRTIHNYNATTDKMETFQFTRDLTDPHAPFVPVHNVKQK
ncbi:uncharacterized protein [Chelonus insularis]|uniref:uncharacterized protein n=1 Tax=Chelonus insularis TaxID=460826 RepID=UPI00158B37FB|nr:uncharacterized protein LOC118067783 [Chelonus insularis]